MVVIDGCSISCAKKFLEEAGITNYSHIQLADLGFEKGETVPTNKNIMTVYKKAVELCN
ncbi:MAG: hypothetical protein JXQ65_14160 [Candidatus Marinimicrobia bacterium]|nr:hypothetical protein [Candidatus Neomarinimicrobiota bacterium]